MDPAPEINPDAQDAVAANPNPNPLFIQGPVPAANHDENNVTVLRPRPGVIIIIKTRDFSQDPNIDNPHYGINCRVQEGIIYIDVAPEVSRRVLNVVIRNAMREQFNNNPEQNYTDVVMSFNRFLYYQHLDRIFTTKIDSEDLPLSMDTVRLPAAPKKGMERSRPSNMPGAPSNGHFYQYRPSNDPAYNRDVRVLQEQRAAKKLRKANRVKRLHPVSRKGLFKEVDSKTTSAATSTSGSVSDQGDDSIGVEGWEEDCLPSKDIQWEK